MDRVQSLSQAYSQAPWRKQLQMIGLFLLLLVVVAIIAGVYLNVTARSATIGRNIQSMQVEVEQLQQDNADLQSRLASMTSAAEMEKRAREMGFEPLQTDQALYLVVPGYTEREPVILAPSNVQVVASAPVLPREYTESLFDWLQRQLLQSSFPLIKVKP